MKKMIIFISILIAALIIVFIVIFNSVEKDNKGYQSPRAVSLNRPNIEVSYYEDYVHGQADYKELSQEEVLIRKKDKQRFAITLSSNATGDAVTTIRINPNGTSTVWQLYPLFGKDDTFTPEYDEITLNYTYESDASENLGYVAIYFREKNGYNSFRLGQMNKTTWKNLEELVTPFIKASMNDDLDR